MILHYTEESGTNLKDKQSDFFVLAALAISAHVVPSVDRAVVDFKRAQVSWAKAEDFELKATAIRHGHGIFSGRPPRANLGLLVELGKMIGQLPLEVLVVAIDKRDLPDTFISSEQVYNGAFRRLLDLILESLKNKNENGLLMFDARSNQHTAVEDRRLIETYREYMAQRGHPTLIVEPPWFGVSSFYAGLQLADICAHLTAQALQKGYAHQPASGKSFEEVIAFEALRPRISTLVILP